MQLLWKLNDYLACILHGLKLRKLADPRPTAARPRDLAALRSFGLPLLGGIACLGVLNLAVDLLARPPLTAVTLALLTIALLGALGWLGWRAHAHWGEFREYQTNVGLVFGIDLEQLQGVEDVEYLGAVFDQLTGVITCSSFTLSPGGTRMQLGNRKFPWDSDLSVSDIRAGIARLQQNPAALAQFLIQYGGKETRTEQSAEDPPATFPAPRVPCLGPAATTE